MSSTLTGRTTPLTRRLWLPYGNHKRRVSVTKSPPGWPRPLVGGVLAQLRPEHVPGLGTHELVEDPAPSRLPGPRGPAGPTEALAAASCRPVPLLARPLPARPRDGGSSRALADRTRALGRTAVAPARSTTSGPDPALRRCRGTTPFRGRDRLIVADAHRRSPPRP